MDPDMTDKERLEYFRGQEREYKKRIERTRSWICLGNKALLVLRLLQRIRDRLQKWYHDEGDITHLSIQFLNKLGNVMLLKGILKFQWSKENFPKQLRTGYTFDIEAGKQALRNINSLALFSNIEVNLWPDEKNEESIIVEIKLKELDQKTAEISTEWSFVPGQGGR